MPSSFPFHTCQNTPQEFLTPWAIWGCSKHPLWPFLSKPHTCTEVSSNAKSRKLETGCWVNESQTLQKSMVFNSPSYSACLITFPVLFFS